MASPQGLRVLEPKVSHLWLVVESTLVVLCVVEVVIRSDNVHILQLDVP